MVASRLYPTGVSGADNLAPSLRREMSRVWADFLLKSRILFDLTYLLSIS